MKNVKKISVSIVVGLMLISIFATSAFASSYSSTLSFNTTLNGAKRYFDGQNIGMSMTVNNGGTNASFTAGLWRHQWYGSSFVGSANYYGGMTINGVMLDLEIITFIFLKIIQIMLPPITLGLILIM